MDIPTKDKPNHYCALCNCITVFQNPDKTINLDKYREVAFKMSNGSIMTVGFCPDCLMEAQYNSLKYPLIMASVIDGWTKEMIQDKWLEANVEEYKKNFFTLTIVDWNKG